MKEAKSEAEKLLELDFDHEDVYHVEEALINLHEADPSITSMPALEHVRNMIAARVGMEIYEKGHFAKESDSG